MAKLVKANGEVLDAYPANGRAFTLAEMQAFVGGYIEIVRTANEDVLLIVNEEGAISDPPLPPNRIASSMYAEAGGDPAWGVRGDVPVGTTDELGG